VICDLGFAISEKGAIKTFSIWDLESRIADLGTGLRLDKEGAPKNLFNLGSGIRIPDLGMGLPLDKEGSPKTFSISDLESRMADLGMGLRLDKEGSPKTGLAQINEKGDHKNPSFAKRDRGWRALPIILFAFRMSYANCRMV